MANASGRSEGWLGRMLNVHDVTRQHTVRRRRMVEEQRLINHGVRYIGTTVGRRREVEGQKADQPRRSVHRPMHEYGLARNGARSSDTTSQPHGHLNQGTQGIAATGNPRR